MLQARRPEQTPLTKQLNRLTNQILVIAGVALAISIGLGLLRGQPFDVLFLTAVAFAVSAIPTGLPAVVTTILAAGTSTLAKAGAIVKRLRSVETLGSTSAINSDKTGTLTLNQMTAVQMAVVGQRFTITGEGYSTVGQITGEAGRGDVPLERYLLPMALCADAVARDGQLVGRSDRGRARRAGREGRRRPGADPRAVSADRRGPVRRRLQVHGHVPPDEGRRRPRRHPLLRQGRSRPAAGPRQRTPSARMAAIVPVADGPRPLHGRERAPRRPGPAGHGDGAARPRSRHLRPDAADLLPLVERPHAARARGHRRPAAAGGEGGDRQGPVGRDPGRG